MKAAGRMWVVTAACATLTALVSNRAIAADVTDADRTYRNFTREAATLSKGQIRLEVRALSLHDEENTVLNVEGFRLRSLYGETFKDPADPTKVSPNKVRKISSGQIDLVTSYGLADNAEVGVIVPGRFETVRFEGNPAVEHQDIGDLQLYGKFKHTVAEHCNLGGGVELSLPNGPVNTGFGSGELGVTPFLGTRYQKGPLGLGINVGYQFFGGSPKAVDNTFLWGVEGIARAGEIWAIRAEVVGRLFTQGGTQFNDITILPGIDFNLTQNITIRPTFLANGTNSALDWGAGLGIAAIL